MATTLDSVDLLGSDVVHTRPRPRFARPAPPPKAMERLPAAGPTTAAMDAPVWPGAQAAPPVRARSVEIALPRLPRPAAATLVPAEEPPAPRPADPPPPAVPAPPPTPSVAEAPVPLSAYAHLFDDTAEAFFARDPAIERYFDARPEGIPWWALAIPAAAATGALSAVVTAAVLLAAWT